MEDILSATEILNRLEANVGGVLLGQDNAVRKLLAALAAGGHVLLEDIPGTGKTTLAKTLARSIQADFQRVQFTPDLLPTDILGVSVYSQHDGDFRFHPGPVFCQLLLADEINRASPRTQSALLEAMAEGQVSIEGQTRTLDAFFFVIATQNPVDSHGTYPLPEAQLDRFAMRFSLGYLGAELEVAMVTSQQHGHPLEAVTSVCTTDELRWVRARVGDIRISAEIQRYIVDLVQATRSAHGVALGASPRASLALTRSAQALACLDGLDYVTPDHVQELAVPVLAHRLSLEPRERYAGRTEQSVVLNVLEKVPAPI